MSNKWYIAGLHFECVGCGQCCQGPDEGYIWATKKELEMMAEHLKMDIDQFNSYYTQKVGLRRTLIENQKYNDCILLEGRKKCKVYLVRPNQCRTWPFWTGNLESPNTWNEAAVRCPGINRGRHYNFKEIEEIRKQRCWWDGKDNGPASK